jgi:hypothetical protein
MSATDSKVTVDNHWGIVPEGQAAIVLGAGDPSEIVAGPTPESTDIGD